MNDDELRYLHYAANTCIFLSEQILNGHKVNTNYIIERDFLPIFRWIVEKAKESGV